MVKCPRGTKAQIRANREAFTGRGPASAIHFSSPWLYNTSTGHLMFYGEGEGGEALIPHVEVTPDESYEEEKPDLDIIRADKRQPPTTEDEVVYLFVSHFFDVLLDSYEADLCIKPYLAEEVPFQPLYPEDTELYGEDMFYERPPGHPSHDFLTKLYKKRSRKFSHGDLRSRSTRRLRSKTSLTGESSREYLAGEEEEEAIEAPEQEASWKLITPDEEVEMKFTNGAWYNGRLSRRLMEGSGIFFWEDGCCYEGEFIAGSALGCGRLMFSDQSVYEGTIFKAFRHGEGLFCMYDSPVMYSGEWWLGKKHGHGLIVYNDPSKGVNYYSGGWSNGVKEGFGCRHYPSGAKYIGFWHNGKRHGKGVMIWANRDVYRGEWDNGIMHGYGEYTWSACINKTFSYAASNTHRGQWSAGKRNGEGVLELLNGATIETSWVDNLKEGKGAVVCNNGLVVTSGNLFHNDKPALINDEKCDNTGLMLRQRNAVWMAENKNVKDAAGGVELMSFLNSIGRAKAVSIPIHSGSHTIDTSPYLLQLPSKKTGQNPDEISASSWSLGYKVLEEYTYEERLLQNAIIFHSGNIKKLYKNYATIACEVKPTCKCVLLRLFFWQLLIDANLCNRHLSLVEIDEFLAKKELLLIEKPHDPFEKITIWQFMHILIILSWEFYGKHIHEEEVTEVHPSVAAFLKEYRNKEPKSPLADHFHYLLEKDLYPAELNQDEYSLPMCRDLVPINAMYIVYKSLGEPHTVRTFLNKACVRRPFRPQPPELVRCFEKLPMYKVAGENAMPIGADIAYFPQAKPLNHPEMFPCEEGTSEEVLKSRLTCFNDLKPKGVVKCISKVCPNIMKDNVIVNMEYQITFIEFYKIVVLCAELALRKDVIEKIKPEIIQKYKEDREEYVRLLEEYERLKAEQKKKAGSTSGSGRKRGRK